MRHLFKNSANAENAAFKTINDAYYGNLAVYYAKLLIQGYLKSVQYDYLVYRTTYRNRYKTDYRYYFESIITRLEDYLDYCDTILTNN